MLSGRAAGTSMIDGVGHGRIAINDVQPNPAREILYLCVRQRTESTVDLVHHRH
jgi:hypothetical protein